MVWQFLLRAALFAALLGGSYASHAASKTATLGVTATLLPACTAGSVSSGAVSFGTLNFGTYLTLDSAVSMVSQAGSGALRINCLNNTPYRVLISAGGSGSVANRSMTGPSAKTLRYNLYTDAAYTTVWNDSTGVSRTGNGQDQWLPVYGRVPAQTVPLAGVYTDTLTVTISW